jgi:thioredoxin 1
MKETIITFIIALFVGSAINGYLTEPQGEASAGDVGVPVQPQAKTTSDAGGETQKVVAEATTADLPVVNESNFQNEVIDEKQPVLVSFSRANCSHCVKMQPIVTQLAHEYSGAIKVVQADVMENPEISEKYQIYGVPAFLIVDHGKVQGPFVGEMPKTKLAALIRPHVKVSETAATPKYSG